MHLLFCLNCTDANSAIFINAGNWAQSDYRRWGLKIDSGYIHREYYIGSSNNRQSLLALKANVWYEAVLVVNSQGQFKAVVWERDNPGVWAESLATFATSDWNRSDWRYMAQAHTGTLDMDTYQEHAAGAMGQRSAMNDPSGSSAWQFDQRGRVVKETKTISGQPFITE